MLCHGGMQAFIEQAAATQSIFLCYVVEQALALFHQFRRLRTRFDKRADIHEAFMTIGCAMICWRRLHSPEVHF